MAVKAKKTLRWHGIELRRNFSTLKPVKIRVLPIRQKEDAVAKTQEREKYFLITIDKGTKLGDQKEALWHEWAHCMVGWTNNHQHTGVWGAAYADIYRHMQDEV